MSEQQKFMEALTRLAVYAQETGNVLTKTEVEEIFRDMSLSEQQFDLIYRYLFEKNNDTGDSTGASGTGGTCAECGSTGGA